MQITVQLPDDLAQNPNPAREALEAFAIEGYRSGALSAYRTRLMLGFETRYEIDGFLKAHKVWDHAYSAEDLEKDGRDSTENMIVVADNTTLNYIILTGFNQNDKEERRMSTERFSQFHCLTKDGWRPLAEEESKPIGWVRVCEMEVYQGSGFGDESRNWKNCTTNPEFTEQEADLLEERYPRPSLKRKWLRPGNFLSLSK